MFVIASASRILSSEVSPAAFITSYTFDARSDVSSGMAVCPQAPRRTQRALNKVSSIVLRRGGRVQRCPRGHHRKVRTGPNYPAPAPRARGENQGLVAGRGGGAARAPLSLPH